MPYYTVSNTVCSSTQYDGQCQKTNTYEVSGGNGGTGGTGGVGEGYLQTAGDGVGGTEGTTNPCGASEFGSGGPRGADGKKGGTGGAYGQDGEGNGEDIVSVRYVAGGRSGRSVTGANFRVDDGTLGGTNATLKGDVVINANI
jgi:hypothetical protein